MRRIILSFTIILSMFLISCTKDADYYAKNPEKAREKVNSCFKDFADLIFKDKNDKKVKECQMAMEGLEKYTENTYKDKSYKEINGAIKEKECGLISLNPECSKLKELSTNKYEEYKKELKAKIEKEYNEEYGNKSYKEIHDDIQKELKKLPNKFCFLETDECDEPDIRREILKQILEDKYKEFEENYKKDTIVKYNKMSLEDFSDENDKIKKLDAGYFLPQTLEEKINRVKKDVFDSYKTTYVEKAKKERHDDIVKKYGDYTFEALLEVQKKINGRIKQDWFDVQCYNQKHKKYQKGLFCDVMKEDKVAIKELVAKAREKEVDKEYNKLKAKYKNESWNKIMSLWVTQNKHYIYNADDLKAKNFYDDSDSNKTRAFDKLYLEKREEGMKKLKSIPDKDILSKEKTYCVDTRKLSACYLFTDEINERLENKYDEFVKAYKILSLKDLEKLSKSSNLAYYNYITKEKRLEAMKNMKFQEAKKYGEEVCKVSYGYNYYTIVCVPIQDIIRVKEKEVVNYYVNNPEKIKEIVNKCVKSKKCGLYEYPYEQVREAMSVLGSYSYDQRQFYEGIK